MNSKKTPLMDDKKNEPLAYLTGKQAFWTMDLIVTKDTLIPYRETECLVEWILNYCTEEVIRLVDLGTGTGAIAIALAIEKPRWHIDAADISEKALNVAKQNAKRYACSNISFYLSDWFAALPNEKYDIIVSNPPYVPASDVPSLMNLTHQPQEALIGGKKGISHIINITQHARAFLKPGGVLIIEHGFNQTKDVVDLFRQAGFLKITACQDLSGIDRFVVGTL